VANEDYKLFWSLASWRA